MNALYIEKECLFIEGNVTIPLLADLVIKLKSLLFKQDIQAVDFSKLAHCDMAILVLLLEILRIRADQKKLKFVYMPAKVEKLAKLSNIYCLLESGS